MYSSPPKLVLLLATELKPFSDGSLSFLLVGERIRLVVVVVVRCQCTTITLLITATLRLLIFQGMIASTSLTFVQQRRRSGERRSLLFHLDVLVVTGHFLFAGTRAGRTGLILEAREWRVPSERHGGIDLVVILLVVVFFFLVIEIVTFHFEFFGRRDRIRLLSGFAHWKMTGRSGVRRWIACFWFGIGQTKTRIGLEQRDDRRGESRSFALLWSPRPWRSLWLERGVDRSSEYHRCWTDRLWTCNHRSLGEWRERSISWRSTSSRIHWRWI